MFFSSSYSHWAVLIKKTGYDAGYVVRIKTVALSGTLAKISLISFAVINCTFLKTLGASQQPGGNVELKL